jgi:hypothetical protein
VGEERRVFKGLGLVAEVGGHPAGEGDDIGGMSHVDFRFGILDFRLGGLVKVILGEIKRRSHF